MRGLLEGRQKLFLCVATVDILALTMGMMIGWSSPVIEKLRTLTDDNPLSAALTSTQQSWIGSLLSLGAVFGPFPFAYILNKIGRKYTVLLVAVPFIVAYFIAAFAKVAELFFVVRLLAGISLGATVTILPIYIAEISDVKVRGLLGTSMANFICFGILVSYCLGPYLSIMWLNIVEVFVPITMVLLSYFIPESPYYLLDNKLNIEAENVLVMLRQTSAKEVQNELKEIEDSLMRSKANRGTFFDIFKTKETTKAFIIATMLCIFQQLCGVNIVLFYTQTIFATAGSRMDSAIPPIIIAAVQLITTFITPTVIDRWGRKILLSGSALGMMLADLPLGVYFHFQTQGYDVEFVSWLPLVTLMVFIVMYIVGFCAVPFTVIAEIFPNNIKGIAVSFATASGNLASFFLVFYFASIEDAIGIGGAFWICAGCAALASVFVIFYVPETKGKTFQEIQNILRS